MIDVVFLWHMHQPYYVNPVTKTAMMPWVRLHAVKGYLDMITVARRYPDVKLNFNVTPVLAKQLLELQDGSTTDLWAERSRKPANLLTQEDKSRLLEDFFKINWNNLIEPYARYHELLELRGKGYDLGTLKECVRLFEESDYRDLQTWYNLAWCGFSACQQYPELNQLKAKGRHFTEEEKNRVLDIHFEIVGKILDLYREAQESGQIEITTTPFYHPIMPLVYNTDFAQRCMPGRQLPPRFQAPDDVRAQLRLAQETHKHCFGTPAKGLWPSEGSVCPELIPLFKEAGFEYFLTDEEVLFRSLDQDPAWAGKKADHLELFQLWQCRHGDAQIQAFFRERPLSDFVGFTAAGQPPHQAVEHLIHHLEHLDEVVPHENGIVSVVLDGENAWEAFADGGEGFLNLLYQRISESDRLRPMRLNEVSNQAPPKHTLSHLHTGSWISGNFDIWIADPEENQGWEWLSKTRAFLESRQKGGTISPEILEKAWMEIYAGEGSDWFWWYGPDFQTDCDYLFDELFRMHLKNVYLLLEETAPEYLDFPIRKRGTPSRHISPVSFITPELGKEAVGFYDWLGSGYMNLQASGAGTMFQGDSIGREFYFGFNDKTFFFRLETSGEWPDTITISFHKPYPVRICLTREKASSKKVSFVTSIEHSEDGIHFQPGKEKPVVKTPGRIEGSCSLSALGWNGAGESVSMVITLQQGELHKETYPPTGLIEFTAPSPHFVLENWFI